MFLIHVGAVNGVAYYQMLYTTLSFRDTLVTSWPLVINYYNITADKRICISLTSRKSKPWGHSLLDQTFFWDTSNLK